ncbi:hypothetical protein [Melittangium boletus]|uniref:Uncharacterized protein n=1 Tax=Melittangium boletus DSM 14713 TaxID=1294270 RepID=A0A250INK5_9BACT|nr:hypothetical protein [Melittangium boletus]ATB32747.1 hypothetical protein MEBOL_006236 [Melittangium boletus DSM 14713]
MKQLTSKVIAELGLELDTELTSVAYAPAPNDPVAQGRATASEMSRSGKLAELLRAAPVFNQIQLEGLAERLPGLQLRRWLSDPCIVLVEAGPVRGSKSFGAHEWLDEGASLVLDSRQEPTFVRLEGSTRVCILSCQQGNVELLEAATPTSSAALDALEKWHPTPVPDVPKPDIRALTVGCQVQNWLLAEAEQMASAAWPLRRLCAAGLVARLWSPKDSRKLQESLTHALNPSWGPKKATVDWFRALDQGVRHQAESSAMEEADELGQQFPALQAHVLLNPESATSHCLQWLLNRDDLECALFLLRCTETGESLEGKLAELDRHASEFESLWAMLDVSENERLRAVAWQEPEAWWGQLALA